MTGAGETRSLFRRQHILCVEGVRVQIGFIYRFTFKTRLLFSRTMSSIVAIMDEANSSVKAALLDLAMDL